MTTETPKRCKACALFFNDKYFCAHLEDHELAELNSPSFKASLRRGESISEKVFNRHPHVFLKDHKKVPVPQRDLAEYFGMQPETISRCFKDPEERGIITVTETSAVRVRKAPDLRLIANGETEDLLSSGIRILQLGSG